MIAARTKFVLGALVGALIFGLASFSRANSLYLEELCLNEKPSFVEDESLSQGNIKAIYMDGPSYQGRSSKVFAYYGIPKVVPGSKVPAIVLIHGGGGTAYPEWVKLWVDRGYAAIALDLFGNAPSANGQRIPVEGGGPTCGPDFVHLGDPFSDQWPFYAENAIARARTLLGSFPEVDDKKVGISGISWGGFLSSMASVLDKRYAFAIHVYSSGYLKHGSAWETELNEPGKERWSEWFDPSNYLAATKTPTLWLTGTNDAAFSFESFVRTYQLIRDAQLYLCIRINMPHGHPEGWSPPEIEAFANSITKGSTKLPTVYEPTNRIGKETSVKFRSDSPIERAELVVGRRGAQNWKVRNWEAFPAKISKDKVEAEVPRDAQFYFFNIYDQKGLMISSQIEEANPQ